MLLASLVLTVPVAGQRRMENVVYTVDAAGEHRGDVYLPDKTGPFPAVVFLHGGAWRSGSKGEFRRMGIDLARAGYASFAVDYDLKARSFPLSWTEARAAVRFVRAHAAEYHVDPKRIVIAGTSAGGELAALVALAPEGPESTRTSDAGEIPVAGAVILNGVFDLCFPAHVIKRYLGGDCASHKAMYTDASPVSHVHADAPPFFVGHGTRDHVVPYLAAALFVKDLERAHVPVTPYTADGPHMYWTKPKYYPANLAAVEQFLTQTLADGR